MSNISRLKALRSDREKRTVACLWGRAEISARALIIPFTSFGNLNGFAKSQTYKVRLKKREQMIF